MGKTGSHIEKDVYLKVCNCVLPSVEVSLKGLIKGGVFTGVVTVLLIL